MRLKKVIITATVALVFSICSPVLFGGETINNMMMLGYVIAKGGKIIIEQSLSLNAFQTHTKNCAVITNKSSNRWWFGYVDKYDSELNDKISGTFTLETVDYTLETWKNLGPLAPDANMVEIPSGYGSIIIKPVFEKTGSLTWQDFFRVCYLQDIHGNRIYLNITAPGTLTGSVPEIGLAKASLADVMQPFSGEEKVLEIYAPHDIKVKELKNLSMIAIGRGWLK